VRSSLTRAFDHTRARVRPEVRALPGFRLDGAARLAVPRAVLTGSRFRISPTSGRCASSSAPVKPYRVLPASRHLRNSERTKIAEASIG